MKYKRDEINELLVDYLENDISENLKNDLNIVVKNSPIREKSLRALVETRKIVKEAHPVMPDLSDKFFENLHGRIMADVSQMKIHSPTRLLFASQTWKSYAAVAVLVLVAGSVFMSLLKPTGNFQSATNENNRDMFLSLSVEVPEAFADSLINDRDSDDFFMDAMAEKVAHLEERRASNLINELSE